MWFKKKSSTREYVDVLYSDLVKKLGHIEEAVSRVKLSLSILDAKLALLHDKSAAGFDNLTGAIGAAILEIGTQRKRLESASTVSPDGIQADSIECPDCHRVYDTQSRGIKGKPGASLKCFCGCGLEITPDKVVIRESHA